MIATFSLINACFEDIYFDTFLSLGPIEQVFQEAQSEGFADRITYTEQMLFATEIVSWLTIFAVKMSYLMFFRQILDRLQSHLKYWKAVTGIVLVAGLFCVCSVFICCPRNGVSSGECFLEMTLHLN